MTPFDSRRLLPSEDLTGETWVVNPACELGSPYPRSGSNESDPRGTLRCDHPMSRRPHGYLVSQALR